MLSKERINVYLYKMLGSDELVTQWWHTPNKYWDGRTPAAVFVDDPQAVARYILTFIAK